MTWEVETPPQSQKIKARSEKYGRFSTVKRKAGTLCGFVVRILFFKSKTQMSFYFLRLNSPPMKTPARSKARGCCWLDDSVSAMIELYE